MANESCSFLGGVTAGYRLRDGQTAFARAIFDETVGKGLAYSFDSPVSEIIDANGTVRVVTERGEFRAGKVIVTTPLNVSNDIKYFPPLSDTRREAFSTGSVAFAHKVVSACVCQTVS